MPRPHLCPDMTCRILQSFYTRECFDRGASYTCFGKMEKQHIFIASETRHVNTYSYCIFTPLKGHIRFFINPDDAWSDYLGYAKVMDDANPLVCEECGPISRVGETLHIFTDNGSKLCSKCAVRLGKLKWDSEKKKYGHRKGDV